MTMCVLTEIVESCFEEIESISKIVPHIVTHFDHLCERSTHTQQIHVEKHPIWREKRFIFHSRRSDEPVFWFSLSFDRFVLHSR